MSALIVTIKEYCCFSIALFEVDTYTCSAFLMSITFTRHEEKKRGI